MTRLHLWLADHPVPLGIALVLLTGFFLVQIPRLVIDTSAEGMMAAKDPDKAYYDTVKKKFGSDSLTIILIKADDVFTTPVLEQIKRLSDGLEGIEGVTRVESLTTVKNLKGEQDALNTEPLVGPTVPTAVSGLQRIRRDALENEVFVGGIVARDAKAAAINVFTDPSAGDTAFNTRFAAAVEALITGERGRTVAGVRDLYQIGGPIVKTVFAEHIAADQRNLVPISGVILFVILYISFRMLQGVVIPLVTGLISIIWGLGLMALFGYPVTVITAMVPSLLITIGFTEDVHMISEYHRNLEQGQPKLEAIRHMMVESGLPILVTTATTVLGFGSLITSDITLLIQFGYASAMALTANWVVTICALPILLRLWPVPRRIQRLALEDETAGGTIPRLMTRLGAFNLTYRTPIIVVAGVLTLLSLVGWYHLKVNTDFISYFPRGSFVRQRMADLHTTMAGAAAFYVVVESGREDGIKNPDLLRRIAGLQAFLAGSGEIDKSISVADYLRKMHREMNNGDLRYNDIPDSPELVAQYLLMLDDRELAKFVDYNYSTANVVVRHNVTSSWELSRLLKKLDRHIAANFPRDVKVRATGEGILINNAADYMALNAVTSFAWTFVVISILHSLLFVSLRAGFLSMIPNVVPVLWNFGLMGLLGIPLNTGTALIASIAIGIAVDDTVHHMVRYSRELNKHHDQKVAMFNTLRAQGRPVIYVSAALAGGFLALASSNFVSTQHFAILSAFVMLVAAVTELVLTPIIMSSTRLVTLWDLVLLKMRSIQVRETPLFQNLSGWEARKVVLLGALRSLEAGERAVQQGDVDSGMYLVVSGRLRACVSANGEERVVARLQPGDLFGEMALIERAPRSASVIAEESAEVLRFDAAALDRLRRRFPFTSLKLHHNIARVLSARLRETTQAAVRAGAGAEAEWRTGDLVALPIPRRPAERGPSGATIRHDA